MDQGYGMLGFLVIVILYAVIGLVAAAGAVSMTRKIFGPRAEQVFYGMFLIMIAAFYLAFAAYFGAATAWRLETAVVLAFVAIGLVGARLPLALIIGYPLHGLWTSCTNFRHQEVKDPREDASGAFVARNHRSRQ